jgi:mRNA interferase RelE/StbE
MSSRYSVRFTRTAEKELQAQDAPVRARILRNIGALADNPRPPGVKRLTAADNLWRIRVGDYRIVYEIHDAELIVRLIRIAHRSKAYRSL